MEPIDLLYTILMLRLVGNNLEVIVNTINLGMVRLLIPVEVLFDFSKRMLEDYGDEN